MIPDFTDDPDNLNIGGTTDLCGADLRNRTLYGLQANNIQGVGVQFDGTRFNWVSFSDAHMRRASFRGCRFTTAYFRDTDLREADFSAATLEDASFRGANLQGAILRNADLRNANLRGADLRGAKMEGIRLDGAILNGTRGPLAAIQFGRHRLIVAGGNVHINGDRYSYAEWQTHGEHILREMQYSEPEVGMYMSASRSAIAWLSYSEA